MSGTGTGEFNRRSILASVAAGLGMFVGPTPMASVAAALFMVPIMQHFGLTTGQMSLLLLIQPITVTLCSASAGRAIDHFGVRRVLLPALIMFVLAFVGMSMVQAVWQWALCIIVMGVCVSIHCYSSYTKVLSQWFDRHRGLMLGITITFGSGLGAMTLPQVAGPWIQEHGWRSAYLLLAGMIAIIGLPAVYLFLREPGGAAGAGSAPGTAAVAAQEGMTRAEAMRSGTFWLIAIAIFLAPMTIVGTVQHSMALLGERGFTPEQARNALSSIYIGGMTGYFTSGPLLEWLRTPRIAVVYFIAALVGIALLHGTADPNLLVPAAILMGLGQGAEMCIAAYLTSRFFGLKAYGSIYGTFYAIANGGIATGIVVMGLVHDAAGSYGPMRYVFLAAMLGVIVLFALLPRYRYARSSDRTG